MTDEREVFGGVSKPSGDSDDKTGDRVDEIDEVEFAIGDASRRASEIVSQERESHGDAARNHNQIAELWSAFLRDKLSEDISGYEAACCMMMVKLSRMQSGTLIADHFVDIAGYADVGLYTAIESTGTEVDLDGL